MPLLPVPPATDGRQLVAYLACHRCRLVPVSARTAAAAGCLRSRSGGVSSQQGGKSHRWKSSGCTNGHPSTPVCPNPHSMDVYLVTPESELPTTARALESLAALEKHARRLPSPLPPTFAHLVPDTLKQYAHGRRELPGAADGGAGANWNEVLQRKGTFDQPKEKFSVRVLRDNFMLKPRKGPSQAMAAPAGARVPAAAAPQDLAWQSPAAPAAVPSSAVSHAAAASLRTYLAPTAAQGMAAAAAPGPATLTSKQELAEVKKAITPMVNRLWKLDFAPAGSKKKFNPFISVIDRDNYITMWNLPTYFDVVSEPMNLTWIKKRAVDRHYASVAAFAADVYLMVDNALRFNKPGEPVYNNALQLREVFIRELQQAGLDAGGYAGGGGAGDGSYEAGGGSYDDSDGFGGGGGYRDDGVANKGGWRGGGGGGGGSEAGASPSAKKPRNS